MNKILAVVVLVVVIGFGAWYFLRGDYGEKRDEMQATSTSEEAFVREEGAIATETIIYTNEGFSPSALTIQAGETVEFKNESSHEMWPASAMHPTHTGYPGTDIGKCGIAGGGEMFDSCGGVAPGASWSFTFSEKGEWAYHDHLSAKYFGKIIVE